MSKSPVPGRMTSRMLTSHLPKTVSPFTLLTFQVKHLENVSTLSFCHRETVNSGALNLYFPLLMPSLNPTTFGVRDAVSV